MLPKKFSLLIIDEDREVRECLWDLFRGPDYEVILAENPVAALRVLPEDFEEAWPDVIVLGQMPQAGTPDSFLAQIRAERPQLLDHVTVIVFPSFRLPLPTRGEPPQKYTHACRLSTISNLLSLVRGLAKKQMSSMKTH